MSSDDQASRTEFVQRELERMHVSNLLPDIYRNVSFFSNQCGYVVVFSNQCGYVVVFYINQVGLN